MWHQDPASTVINGHAVARAKIDVAIAAAVLDADLNKILSQYLFEKPVIATPLPSEVLANDARGLSPNVPFNESDIRRIVNSLARDGSLDGLDLEITALNIVLPRGMTLEIIGIDGAECPVGTILMQGVPDDSPNYSTGTAGYHGTVPIVLKGQKVEVLYSVVVWSDGSIGIPVPGWEGWENIAATLYHELQEIRTNPYVDCAVRTGEVKYVGWNSEPIEGPDGHDFREIADLPLLIHHDAQHEAFMRVSVMAADGTMMAVPIQRLWCNKSCSLQPASP